MDRARARARRTSTLLPMLTSARPPTLAWEVARTVVAQPPIAAKWFGRVFRSVVWWFLCCVCCACEAYNKQPTQSNKKTFRPENEIKSAASFPASPTTCRTSISRTRKQRRWTTKSSERATMSSPRRCSGWGSSGSRRARAVTCNTSANCQYDMGLAMANGPVHTPRLLCHCELISFLLTACSPPLAGSARPGDHPAGGGDASMRLDADEPHQRAVRRRTICLFWSSPSFTAEFICLVS